jgi:hypothetical protein
MSSSLRSVLSKDISSIVSKYLLPDKNEMKKLYSAIINEFSLLGLTYPKASIKSGYYYFKLRQLHGSYKNIKHCWMNFYVINYNVPNCHEVQQLYENKKISPYNEKNIRRYINSDFDNISFFIELENITYSDIIKCKNKHIKDLWFEKKKKLIFKKN